MDQQALINALQMIENLLQVYGERLDHLEKQVQSLTEEVKQQQFQRQESEE